MNDSRRRRGTALRLLRTVPDVRVALALLFAATLAAPRAPLVLHHHAGGAHAHAHGEAALLALGGHGDAAAHPDAPSGTRARPAFARDTGASDAHVHHQDRYQAAVVPTAACLAAAAALPPPPAPRAQRPPSGRSARASARAPPVPSLA